ncbi:hypothetical protein CKA38_11495 [Ereboglobus luteus]|uniref:Transglutaminase-like domain-containing protein n=2 Tax=Ereboglobus luteus TaxID=1796921 RepID=A0A2U8E4E6_9BACT|nr:hypothetical protein CKA38_11495 [Ereboglobus luteus]
MFRKYKLPAVLCILAVFLTHSFARAYDRIPAHQRMLAFVDWIAPTPEELSATASTIDPEAGAEILLRMRQIDDSEYIAPATDEYFRIKIFNEKGVRQFTKVDITCEPGERFVTSGARVIKPDGTIINVDEKAFYDRITIKYGGKKARTRSFSFPQLEPGDIAEYKYCITANDNIVAARFYFLSEIPTRHAVFRIKPAPLAASYKTMAYFYKCDEVKVQHDDDGFNCIELKNLPAHVPEPCMEPDQDAQPWILFYPVMRGQTAQAFWEKTAKDAGKRVERYAKKPSKLVRETATRIVANATSTEEKLARINDYCRTNIVNYWVYTPKGGHDEKIRAMRDRSPDELIKTKLGNSDDIPVLFVALARAAGIDARIALCANRNDGVFKMTLPIEYYLNEIFIAVKLDKGWRMYDPAHNMVSLGMLRWQNEGVPALIVMPKGAEWITTAMTSAKRSLTKRTAKLRLNEEGTLFGDVTIEYSGQAEITARYQFHNETDKRIEELVKEDVQARLPNAELTDINVTNSGNVLKPLVLTYSVKVPGYAERTGQRLFIQPCFFTKGEPARFTRDTRTHNMFFRYGESFKDEVTIQVPAGFALEEGSAPVNLEPGNWGYYKTSIALKKKTNEIIYTREFAFAPLLVPAEAYKAVKYIFDTVHSRDSHTLTLRSGG